MKWLNNLKTYQKILTIIIVSSIFVLVAGSIGYYYDNQARKIMFHLHEHRLINFKLATFALTELQREQLSLYEFILNTDSIKRNNQVLQIKTSRTKANNFILNYSKSMLNAEEGIILNRVKKNYSNYTKLIEKIIDLASQNKLNNAYEYYQANIAIHDSLVKDLKKLADYNIEQLKSGYKQSSKVEIQATFISLGGILIALSLSIFFGLFVANLISKPIEEVAESIKKVASGDFNVSDIDIKSKDEIGMLAKAFNKMTSDLRELDEEKKRFLAILTHDLRSPIIAEQKALEVIIAGKIGSKLTDFIEYLQDIYKTNEDLLMIVNNILNVNHLELGNWKLEFEQTDIKKLVNEYVRTLKYFAKDMKSNLFVNIEDELPLINIDKNEIKRVLDNLISNAIKHNKKGTEVTINVKKINNKLQISVRDNGKGISEADCETIFQKYSKTKRKIGTGLGLYLSKQIVEAHQGKIWFESEEGKGAVFTFELSL